MIHMLVVDDEAEEREGILFLLHKYGFNMETGQAPNGKAALDYLKNRAVDILFTDVRMPFMDGLTLAKEALLLQPNIRVILFSGFSEFEYAKTAISFSDITGHWAEATITRWADVGIVNGYPDGTFRPDEFITRAELAKIVTLAFGLTEKTVTELNGIDPNEWYYNYVLTAPDFIT